MAKSKGKDYLTIARKNINRPRDVESWRKALVYGRNKKGKTRFSLSNGIPNTLLLDPEQGTDTMKRLNPYRWPINTWEDLVEAWGAIRTYELSPKALGMGKETKPFDTFAVDGCTKFNNYALKYIGRVAAEQDLTRRPGLVQRPDYFKSGELMKGMIDNFLKLRANVIFTAQERMITPKFGTDDDESDDDVEEQEVMFVPDLPAGVRGALNSVVDVIGRIYVVNVEIKGERKKQRRLHIGVNDRYDTGYRSDYVMPEYVRNPTFPTLMKLIETGKVG